MTGPSQTFWSGKRVLLTGHTGFKGAWASCWLTELGANVTGIALPPAGSENLYRIVEDSLGITSIEADIRDAVALRRLIVASKPQIVLHMAAQALVRASYADPDGTWQTNVQGTLNLLEAVKDTGTATHVLVVTSDKVYRNDETGRSFVESDPLGGHDPYSASKAACEILTASWRESFAREAGLKVATARAGNVVGGGDFSEDRLVPDIWRSARDGVPLRLRNPDATRPWQHVLDCLNGYFLFVERGMDLPDAPTTLNFGPSDTETHTVGELASDLVAHIRPSSGWLPDQNRGPREMARLQIDSSLARARLAWRDYISGDALAQWTADWYRAYAEGADMAAICRSQIARFMALTETSR